MFYWISNHQRDTMAAVIAAKLGGRRCKEKANGHALRKQTLMPFHSHRAYTGQRNHQEDGQNFSIVPGLIILNFFRNLMVFTNVISVNLLILANDPGKCPTAKISSALPANRTRVKRGVFGRKCERPEIVRNPVISSTCGTLDGSEGEHFFVSKRQATGSTPAGGAKTRRRLFIGLRRVFIFWNYNVSFKSSGSFRRHQPAR